MKNSELRVHWLNTGWIESKPGVSLMGEGFHPIVPGGQLVSHGWTDDITRPSGETVSGTMIPAPAWYIEGADRKILVDTGTGDAEEVVAAQEKYGGSLATSTPDDHKIEARLATLGVAPEEIDVVIQTHLHFDHIGSNELFKNAVFLINSAELPWALCPPAFGVYYYEEFAHHVLAVRERIRILTGDFVVAPGISIVYTGGHSPGHSVVMVDTAIGRLVIAGDAVYNYRNLEFGWPQGPLFDVGATLNAMNTLRQADVILINHDPLFERLFPSAVIGDEPLPEKTSEYMRRLRTVRSFELEDARVGEWPV